MDLFGIGSTINAISNLATGTMNYKEQKKAREENMAFQREQFEYLKQQNALQQQREDTAVQRKMQDLRNSGLNPLAADATGGASTGATGSTTSFSGEQAAQMGTDLMSGLQIEADSLYNLMSQRNGLAQQQAQTDLLQQEKLNKEQDILESQSRIASNTSDQNLKKAQERQIAEQNKKIRQETTNLKTQNDINNWNYNYSQNQNLRTTDALGNFSIKAGPLSISGNENMMPLRTNPFYQAAGRLGSEISQTINNGIDGIKNWAKSKYRQMRGKAK